MYIPTARLRKTYWLLGRRRFCLACYAIEHGNNNGDTFFLIFVTE
jgi:hypothetical protein